MSQPHVKAALGHLDAHLPDFQRTLVELSRIPSVSAEGYPPEEVRRSASGVKVSNLTKSKLSMVCSLPSSRTSKSAGVSPSTILPSSTG